MNAFHNFDILCVGNAKIDIFLTLHEANDHLRFAKDSNELCLKFGEKITVDKAEILLGGNASNVSVGLARLGLSVGLMAEIGKDEFAQKIIKILNSEKVDVSNVSQIEKQQSSFSVILNFKKERTIFSEHVARDHDFNFENITTKWIYLTSIGEAWENAYEKTSEFTKNSSSLLIFNPGTLQISVGAKKLTNVLQSTNVLIVNKEEGQILLANNNLNMQGILLGLQKLGPKTVVITDGKNGSHAVDEKGEFYKQGAIATEVVEKTGAGDAYSAGFTAALLLDKPISEAMIWGAKNSASVIAKVGAQTGLLRKNDLNNNA